MMCDRFSSLSRRHSAQGIFYCVLTSRISCAALWRRLHVPVSLQLLKPSPRSCLNVRQAVDQCLNIKPFASENEHFRGWIEQSQYVFVLDRGASYGVTGPNHVVNDILVWASFCPVVQTLIKVLKMVSQRPVLESVVVGYLKAIAQICATLLCPLIFFGDYSRPAATSASRRHYCAAGNHPLHERTPTGSHGFVARCSSAELNQRRTHTALQVH